MLTILILLILLTVISAVTFGKINLWHSHFPSPVIWMIITTRRIRVARGTKAWNNSSQILEGKRITWRILLKHKNFLKYRLLGDPLPRESEPADLDWAWESASPMLIQTALKTTLWVALGQQPTSSATNTTPSRFLNVSLNYITFHILFHQLGSWVSSLSDLP